MTVFKSPTVPTCCDVEVSMKAKWCAGAALGVAVVCLNGCVLTRIVTMPMRVVGAVTTIVPVAGDAAHEAVDKAADVVDEIPI